MQRLSTSPLARHDTLLGVCQALGEDFGFNPVWLRLVLPVLLFMNPAATIGGYLAAGALVLGTRLLVPNPRIIIEVPEEESVPAAQHAEAPAAEAEPQPVPLAA